MELRYWVSRMGRVGNFRSRILGARVRSCGIAGLPSRIGSWASRILVMGAVVIVGYEIVFGVTILELVSMVLALGIEREATDSPDTRLENPPEGRPHSSKCSAKSHTAEAGKDKERTSRNSHILLLTKANLGSEPSTVAHLFISRVECDQLLPAEFLPGRLVCALRSTCPSPEAGCGSTHPAIDSVGIRDCCPTPRAVRSRSGTVKSKPTAWMFNPICPQVC